MLFEFDESFTRNARIKVAGVGGCGGNIVNNMIAANIRGVEFIAINTDAQDLDQKSLAQTKIQIGKNLTRSLGAGMKPEVGRQAAMEERDRIAGALSGSDLVFITAGMGGGTGTGAAPVVASVAKELGALTIAVVTKPFFYEGPQKKCAAELGVAELEKNVDAIIVIPNDKIKRIVEKGTSLLEFYATANNVLKNAIQGISDMILIPGHQNLDFADLRTVMEDAGRAVIGMGVGRGEGRALFAAKSAIANPLIENCSIEGAKGILINITGGLDLSHDEVEEACGLIFDMAGHANIKVGTVMNPDISEEIRVTVIATGASLEERVSVPEIPVRKTALADVAARPAEKLLSKTVDDLIAELKKTGVGNGLEMAYESSIDVPTFLRKSTVKNLGL